MIRFPKLPALLACILLQLPTLLRAQAPPATNALFADPVVATGEGFEIKRSQVDDAFINYSASVTANGGSIPDGERETVRSKLMDNLIINKILLQKATADDKAAVAKLVDAEIAHARSNAPSPEDFDAEIKARNTTLDKLRSQEIDKMLSQRVLVNALTNGITVPDADVKKFYDDHPDRFEKPETVRAAHLLVSTQDPITKQNLPPDKKREKLKLAQDLKARLDKGENFAALVKQYSDDPGSKDKGGEYTFGKGQMVPEFEAAAFSMKPGQISDLVETKFGYHIIKLLEKFPATKVDFAKAEPDIRDYLIEQKAKAGLPAYLEKLKAGAGVKIVAQGGVTPAK
ncbi:MAG TPA: peptidylprolyl isomerase [Verrucomicrobiae bacterium]|jgi:peptidyl-prolyl cis-trans isomerase C